MTRKILPWLAASVASLAFAQGVVDLDRPGALDELKREQPQHYVKVVEALHRARVAPYVEKDPRVNARKPVQAGQAPEAAAGPPKTKMTIPVENAQYRITVVSEAR